MKCFSCLLFIFITISVCQGQNLDLQTAENAFLKNNLELLAEQFNISAARANVLQARLWENPYFSADVNAINPERNKYFDVGRAGQKEFAVEQLIYLGGKKRAEVELAKTNTVLAELVFKDLLRNLRYQLRTSFFSIYYSQLSASAFEKQLGNLDSLTQAYKLQAEKGNIPLKDVVRLQGLYLDLKSEQTELANSIIGQKSKLAEFIGLAGQPFPSPTEAELSAYQKQLSQSPEGLQATALTERPDIQYSQKSIIAAEQNLKWQKTLAVPDVTFGAACDQFGGAFRNQVNLTVGVPLRLWNRNQGNIRLAGARVDQAWVQKDLVRLQIQNEVTAAYDKYLVAKNNYASVQGDMYDNLDVVYAGVLQNFQKRNISIIEFTDFMESYYKSIIRFNETRKALILSSEEINYVTGTIIF